MRAPPRPRVTPLTGAAPSGYPSGSYPIPLPGLWPHDRHMDETTPGQHIGHETVHDGQDTGPGPDTDTDADRTTGHDGPDTDTDTDPDTDPTVEPGDAPGAPENPGE